MKQEKQINHQKCKAAVVVTIKCLYNWCIYTAAPVGRQNHVTVGPKGETGFTEGTDLQLNTFQEKTRSTVCEVY